MKKASGGAKAHSLIHPLSHSLILFVLRLCSFIHLQHHHLLGLRTARPCDTPNSTNCPAERISRRAQARFMDENVRPLRGRDEPVAFAPAVPFHQARAGDWAWARVCDMPDTESVGALGLLLTVQIN